MKTFTTTIKDAFLIQVERFEDERGYFLESWNQKKFNLPAFVQDNHSQSHEGVLRGLHYQIEPKAQGKLVRCARGAIYDVIVDLRQSSPSFGKWYGVNLDKPTLQVWVPPGLAHGFYTISQVADLQYKTTDYFEPSLERILSWNDSKLGINWSLRDNPILSNKDTYQAKSFSECDKFN